MKNFISLIDDICNTKCFRYNKTESLRPGSQEMMTFTHLLLEAKSKYSTNIKPYTRTHDILESVEGFSHVVFNYNTFPPIRIKTKPLIFILKRKPSYKQVTTVSEIELPQDGYRDSEEDLVDEEVGTEPEVASEINLDEDFQETIEDSGEHFVEMEQETESKEHFVIEKPSKLQKSLEVDKQAKFRERVDAKQRGKFQESVESEKLPKLQKGTEVEPDKLQESVGDVKEIYDSPKEEKKVDKIKESIKKIVEKYKNKIKIKKEMDKKSIKLEEQLGDVDVCPLADSPRKSDFPVRGSDMETEDIIGQFDVHSKTDTGDKLLVSNVSDKMLDVAGTLKLEGDIINSVKFRDKKVESKVPEVTLDDKYSAKEGNIEKNDPKPDLVSENDENMVLRKPRQKKDNADSAKGKALKLTVDERIFRHETVKRGSEEGVLKEGTVDSGTLHINTREIDEESTSKEGSPSTCSDKDSFNEGSEIHAAQEIHISEDQESQKRYVVREMLKTEQKEGSGEKIKNTVKVATQEMMGKETVLESGHVPRASTKEKDNLALEEAKVLPVEKSSKVDGSKVGEETLLKINSTPTK